MQPVHLVLGASGGIGSALARRLAADGAQVVLAGRDATRLEPLARELAAEIEVLEATSFESTERAVRAVSERHGRLDGLACCVGSLKLAPAHRTSEADWRAICAVNLDSAFAAVRAGSAAMLERGGAIALVASVAARIGLPNHEAIAAAKAGVIGLAQAAAASYAPRGIRVNVVAPGLTRTPLAAGLLASPAVEKASVAMHPLGRLGEPDDVARALAWLLDPAQSWVTGQVLGVDGGLSRVRAR